MKKLFAPIVLCLATVALLLLSPGCASSNARLEPGGAYAPVTGTGTNAVANPDYSFFVVDSAYNLAYSTIDAAFKFEHDNRQYLWGLSPQIKKTLDSIRPQAAAADSEYLTGRAAYLANPTPAGLSGLQAILAKVQQYASAISAALPK